MQHNLEAYLAKLVSYQSTANNPSERRAILAYIQEQFEPLGFYMKADLESDTPWIAFTTQPTKNPDIMLAAHLDVVPGAQSLFILRRDDDRLYGRGTYDMKFAAACYIELAKTHADQLRHLNIGFYFSTDEEVGGDSAIEFARDWHPGILFIPDGGGDWHIESKAKGLYGIALTAVGLSSHGSRPWEGNNAIHRIMDFCQDIRALYPLKGTEDATLSVSKIEGGEAFNQTPDSAFASLDFRSFSHDELDSFFDDVMRLSGKYDVAVTVAQQGAPVIFDPNHPESKRFLKAFEKHHPIQYVGSYGGSDARHFAEYGIPAIIVEPHGGGRHGEDEWILAEDLSAYYHLVEDWLFSPTEVQPANH